MDSRKEKQKRGTEKQKERNELCHGDDHGDDDEDEDDEDRGGEEEEEEGTGVTCERVVMPIMEKP